MSSTAAISESQGHARVSPVAWTLDRTVCWLLVFAVVFLMGADFRGGSAETFEVHWQIYLRLLVAFVCGLVGVLLISKSYQDFFTWPGLLVTVYLIWYAVTIPTSIDRTYSAAAWVSLLGVLLFLPGAMRQLGGLGFLSAIASGLVFYLVGSWVAYLFFPEIGVFREQVTQTDVFERMGGLGHPNELGFYSAYTILVFAGLGISGRVHGWIVTAGILLGIITVLVCFSRTAILVSGFGLFFVVQAQCRRRGNAIGVSVALAIVFGGAFLALGSGKLDWAVDRALKKVTKSGSLDELKTATGRTEIWAYGIKKIHESPLYGYGYGSARFIMVDHSFHCHNALLNAAMFGGYVSGVIVLMMFLVLLQGVLLSPRPEIDGLAACMLAGAMVEALISAPSPAASTLIWFSLLYWRQLEMEISAPSSVPTSHVPPQSGLAPGAV